VSFWTHDIFHQQWPLVVLVVAGGAASAWRARGRIALGSPVLYHLAAASGLIASAWMSRLHTGGYANVLMPAYAAIALLAGLAFGNLSRGPRASITGTAAGIMLVVQVVLLAYPLRAQIPTAADRAAGAALIARLRSLPGPVVVLRHPWYATLAGNGTSEAQEEAIHDVLRSGAPRGAQVLRASLSHALDADRVRTVVLDYAGDGTLLGPEFEREFRLQPVPITPPLYPLTDLRTAPRLVYVRRADPGKP
jgi:hypothetical protein